MPAWLVGGLKYGASAVLLVWLFSLPGNRQAVAEVWSQPKDWGLLAAATVLCLATIVTTLVRWHWLLVAIHVPATLRQSVRVGFIGYLFNFISLGVVGGDLVKAVLVCRDHHAHKPEAVASVFVDRVIGLWGLFVVVSITTWVTGIAAEAVPAVRWLCYLAFVATFAVGLGWYIVSLPMFDLTQSGEHFKRRHRVVQILIRLINAVRLYRTCPGIVLGCLAQSAATHCLFATVMMMIAIGLRGPAPSLTSQLIIVPLANLSSIAPLPGGLGAFEFAMAYLYPRVPNTPPLTDGQGLLVAFAYRAMTMLIALVGLAYYLMGRHEVDDAYAEAEADAEKDVGLTADPASPGEAMAGAASAAIVAADPSPRAQPEHGDAREASSLEEPLRDRP